MKSIGNVFVLGDSYSTFKGYIPEGYATYYGDKEEKEKEKEKDKIVAEHFEKKYKEMLEDKWEKEKNEKQSGRMPPPPPPTVK